MQCQNCLAALPAQARYCPRCGMVQTDSTMVPPTPLVFSPWVPPTLQPAEGPAVPVAAPRSGVQLSPAHVIMAVASILLFLGLVLLLGSSGLRFGNRPVRATAPPVPPVVGTMGEIVQLGGTAWGVAFTDEAASVGDRPAHGKYLAVAIVIGNKGANNLLLSDATVNLVDPANGTRYQPTQTAWGTPDGIRAESYTTEFILEPTKAVAGLIIFDVPRTVNATGLLVRDLTTDAKEFTGMIDLTQTQTTPDVPLPAP